MAEDVAPLNSAKALLPVVMLGMLLLMFIMSHYGSNEGVVEYQDRTNTHVSAEVSGRK